MKTEKEIKKKILAMQHGKFNSKYRGDDAGYRSYVKAEKLLKWVLDQEENLTL